MNLEATAIILRKSYILKTKKLNVWNVIDNKYEKYYFTFGHRLRSVDYYKKEGKNHKRWIL